MELPDGKRRFFSQRVCVNAHEFCDRHGLLIDEFYPLLVKNLHSLPRTLRIGGNLRLFDVSGAKGRAFTTRAKLRDFPKDLPPSSWMPVSSFAVAYDLGADDLLDLGVRRQLPMAHNATYQSGRTAVAVGVDDVARWELARCADAVSTC